MVRENYKLWLRMGRDHVEPAVFVIAQDLKINKLLHDLESVGLQRPYWKPNLYRTVFYFCGWNCYHESDMRLYNTLAKNCGAALVADTEDLITQARSIYETLKWIARPKSTTLIRPKFRAGFEWIDLPVFLILQDLRMNKFIHVMKGLNVDFEATHFEPHIYALVFYCCHCSPFYDDIPPIYYKLVDEYSHRVTLQTPEPIEAAEAIYERLMAEIRSEDLKIITKR